MGAVKAYKAIREEEKRIRRLFPQMNQSRGRGGGSMNQHEGGDDNYNQVRNDNQVFFHNQLQAEATLARYGGVRQDNTAGGLNLPSRIRPHSRQYSFNPDNPEYLSKFSIGFKGCLKCGKTDHLNRCFCPIGDDNDPGIIEVFFNELKIHRPHMKKGNGSNSNGKVNTFVRICLNFIMFKELNR